MGIVLLGPPGSGKGTQGTRLAERLGVPHVSTGDVMRAEAEAGTDQGRLIAPFLERGELVPDDLALPVLQRALADARAAGGYVLDGFPRSRAQADHLPGDDLAVHLALPDGEARRRLAARAEGRADDADPEVIDHRLRVYHADTAPLLDLYRSRGRLVTVDASRSTDEVAAAIADAIAAAEG
jgi:adenylate kinase